MILRTIHFLIHLLNWNPKHGNSHFFFLTLIFIIFATTVIFVSPLPITNATTSGILAIPVWWTWYHVSQMPFKPTLLSKRPYSKVARTGIGTSSVHELLPLPKRRFSPFSCFYFPKLIIVTIFLLKVTSTQFMLLIFKDVNWRFSWITISNDKSNLYNFCTHFQMCTPIHASTMWVAPMGSSAPV